MITIMIMSIATVLRSRMPHEPVTLHKTNTRHKPASNCKLYL